MQPDLRSEHVGQLTRAEIGSGQHQTQQENGQTAQSQQDQLLDVDSTAVLFFSQEKKLHRGPPDALEPPFGEEVNQDGNADCGQARVEQSGREQRREWGSRSDHRTSARIACMRLARNVASATSKASVVDSRV